MPIPLWPHDRILHAWWVEPNRLLAGAYPGAHTPEGAEAKLRLLVDAGVETIIDLTTEWDPLEPYDDVLQAVANGRVRRFSYPIPDMGVIDDAGYDQILARINEEMEAGRLVYVHCWGGKGRTSTVIGCLLADSGLDYQATIARIAQLREGTREAYASCPESQPQRDVLRARCGRHQA